MTFSARTRVGLCLASLAAAIALAYSSSFAGSFVLDDVPNIVANTKLTPLWPPTADLWAEPGRGLSGRPLAAFSFALDRALHGLDPRGFHATNLLIHLLAAWALFALVHALLGLARAPEPLRGLRTGVALAVAAAWSLHPLQTTSVTYVVQRCESLMGLCFLAAVWCALRSFGAERPGRWIAGATLAALLGAVVKESIVVLPLVVLVLDAAFESGSLATAWRAHRRLYLALACVWPWIAAWVWLGGSHRASAAGLLPELTWWAWLRSQAAALAHYVRVAVWPDVLLIDYGWPIPRGLGAWLPAGLAVLAALVAALIGFARGSRAAAVLLVGFLLLAPTSSVLPIPFELWALHRMYLPLATLVGLAIAGLLVLAPRARPLAALLVVGAVGAGAWRTHAANREFESPQRLWSAHVDARPENDRAWFQLAEALRARGDAPGALAAYRRAAELHPTFGLWLNNLATLELALGETESAIAHYARACELLPDAWLERTNLVEALLVQGDLERAERELAPLVARGTQGAVAHRLRARILARSGRESEALTELQSALELEPRDFGAFETLVLLRASAADASVRDPAAAERLLANVRAPPAFRAAELGRLAAVAAAAAGRFAEAESGARATLERARSENRPQLVAALERELALYARREPPRGLVR